jgi:hypothetical protein
MPEKVDTGEYINQDVSFQQAMVFAQQQQARIDELEEAVLRMGKRLHQCQHTPLGSMRECKMISCQMVRMLLHQ